MAVAEAGEAAKMQLGGHHVVVFPFPAAGHINPSVSFARSLARYGVAVTFLCPKHELSKVKRSVTDDESFDARENVKLVAYEVPVAAGGLDIVSIDALKYFMYDNIDEFDRIIGELMVEPRTVQYPSPCNGGPPVCIVSDMFLGFTQSIAEKLNIVRYCLFPSPVHFLSLFLHLPKFDAEGLIPMKPEDDPLMIPNFPPIPHGDLSSSLHANNGNPGSHRFLLNEAQQLWKATGVLVSSVEELERPALEGLRHYIDEASPSDQALKVWPIGPLVEGVGEGKISLREKFRETQKEGQYFDWLEQQPDSSVLYICFGTVAMLSDKQVREIAIALKNSGQRFLWVLRIPKDGDGKPHTDLSQVFPEGFLEKTKSKGLVYLDWVSQKHVLAHRAVKGFITHCGWNSTVESILAGVPMIAWPFLADQMTNANLVDKVLGIAIRINESGSAGWRDMIASETIERAIQTLMVEPAGDAMRTKVLQLSGVIEKVVRPGGSSRTNLETFLQEVRTMPTKC